MNADRVKYVNVASVTSERDLRSETGENFQKNPVSGYALFVKHMHAELMQKSPELSFSERASMISTLWLVSSKEEKDSYVIAARRMYDTV